MRSHTAQVDARTGVLIAPALRHDDAHMKSVPRSLTSADGPAITKSWARKPSIARTLSPPTAAGPTWPFDESSGVRHLEDLSVISQDLSVISVAAGLVCVLDRRVTPMWQSG